MQANLERHFNKAQRDNQDALEKLSSGTVFSRNDPRPAERAISEGLEFRLRSLASSKRNINSGISLIQTAEAGLSEISNIILRMKEINVSAASTTLSDKERRFLFIEYEALYDEINRISSTTDYNGIPLLNGNDPKTPEVLIFRFGDPARTPDEELADESSDINQVRFAGLKSVVATTFGLGLRSAKELLLDNNAEEGLSIEDVEELMEAEESDGEEFPTIYDQALNTLSTQRAVFGGIQARMERASSYLDVYQENLAAAKSAIADADYAEQVGRLVESRLRMQAGTAMLAQGNINSTLALNLLQSAI